MIRWGAGSRTALHDHGGSAGALYVVNGDLVEQRPNPAGVGRPLRRTLRALDHRPMSANHIHEIANESARRGHEHPRVLAAVGHHAALRADADSELRVLQQEAITLARAPSTRPMDTLGADDEPRTVDELLADARAALRRVTPPETAGAAAHGALIVDIRPYELRSATGSFPARW